MDPKDLPAWISAGATLAAAVGLFLTHRQLRLTQRIAETEFEDDFFQWHGQTEPTPGCVEAVDEGHELFVIDLDSLVAPVQSEAGVRGSVQRRRERMLNG